jgi:hypothetical protein
MSNIFSKKKSTPTVQHRLQVLHYAQIPCEPFRVDVKDELEAKKIVQVLAQQHLFLYSKRIIPDYSNVICVVMFNEQEGDWTDYYNSKVDMEWDEFERTYLKQ